MLRGNKHLFALKVSQLPPQGDLLQLRDKDLHTRITSILRLREGEAVQLFDDTSSVVVTLSPETFISKNIISGEASEWQPHQKIAPVITLYQSVTKKNVFEEIAYTAAQMGVMTIIPLKTEKAHDLVSNGKEHARLDAIMIAACEQSKQFIKPVLTQPQLLSSLVIDRNSYSVLFDAGGPPLQQLAEDLQQNPPAAINVFIGPEGGYTVQDLAQLHALGVNTFGLTPTILRAKDAAIVALGALRSLI